MTDNKSYPPKVYAMPTRTLPDMALDMANLRTRANKVEAEMQRLVAEGHTCMSVMECYPPKISWCKQTPCSGR